VLVVPEVEIHDEHRQPRILAQLDIGRPEARVRRDMETLHDERGDHPQQIPYAATPAGTAIFKRTSHDDRSNAGVIVDAMPAHLSHRLQTIARAAQGGDEAVLLSELEAVIPHIATMPDETRISLASLALQRRRADLASRLAPETGPQSTTPAARLAHNLAALESHRSTLARAIWPHVGNGPYRAWNDHGGRPTLVRSAGDQHTPVWGDADSRPHLEQVIASASHVLHQGHCIGVAGVIDGGIISWLVDEDGPNGVGMETCILLCEPDVQRFAAMLAVGDLRSMIAADRVHLFIGEDWATRLRSAYHQNPMLPAPGVFICPRPELEDVQSTLRALRAELDALQDEYRSAWRSANLAAPRPPLVNLLRDDRPRPPRIMFLTSRFTTVLQYQSAACAAAFEARGWSTRTVIEQRPWERSVVRAALAHGASFQPDVVFVIDHVRSTFESSLPEGVTLVSWIQDMLPSLLTRDAGASVEPTDFVLTMGRQRFVNDYCYPSSQILPMPKAVASTMTPPSTTVDDALVYIGHGSLAPDATIDTAASRITGDDRPLFFQGARVLLDHYAGGGHCATLASLRAVLATALDGPLSDTVVNLLWHPVNDRLYRHQALHWAIDVAEAHGLDVNLHGRGWSENPRFARYARGVVAPGPDLDRITRHARINLHLAPFSFAHQRVLDGVSAGGFFLLRDHPKNQSWSPLLRFVNDRLPAGVNDLDSAFASLGLEERDVLEQLAREFSERGDGADPVAWARDVRVVSDDDGESRLPRLHDVVFHDRHALADRVRWVLDNPDERCSIVAVQQAAMRRRFDLQTHLDRVMRTIAERLALQETAV